MEIDSYKRKSYVPTHIMTLYSEDNRTYGEKTSEFRKPTKFIKDRLYNKDGSSKHYDLIQMPLNGEQFWKEKILKFGSV